MPAEPISLLSRNADRAAVARRLRELSPDVKIDGPDHDWRSATVTFGKWWKKRRLTLFHDPQYHAEPNWSKQMNGMQGYFSRFPETERKAVATLLPTTFRWMIPTEFHPDPDPRGDPRLDVLYAVAELLDGVLFTPSALRDARGRVLFSAEGAAAEDPEAVWPRVVGEVKVSPESYAGEDEDEEPNPPTAERVARRALALAAVTARATLEEAPKRDAGDRHRKLLDWVRETGIEDELEEAEREVVRRVPGEIDQRSAANAMWRVEGLAVLAWALGRSELPPHDELVDPDTLWRSVGFLDAGAARELVEGAALRPREEIGTLRARLFAVHWRLRDYTIRPRVMDFGEFARTCPFGPLDITGLPLADGDLALRGRRIDQAPPDVFGVAHSAALERHQAANWMWEGPEAYSDASVAT